MKLKSTLAILLVMLMTGTVFALEKSKKISTEAGEIEDNFTKSLYSQTTGMSIAEQELVYTCYLAGFVDAMQMEYLKPGTAGQFLKDCEGLTLAEITTMTKKFKKENPEYIDVNPSTMLMVAVPRLRKGLPPFPEKESGQPSP